MTKRSTPVSTPSKYGALSVQRNGRTATSDRLWGLLDMSSAKDLSGEQILRSCVQQRNRIGKSVHFALALRSGRELMHADGVDRTGKLAAVTPSARSAAP